MYYNRFFYFSLIVNFLIKLIKTIYDNFFLLFLSIVKEFFITTKSIDKLHLQAHNRTKIKSFRDSKSLQINGSIYITRYIMRHLENFNVWLSIIVNRQTSKSLEVTSKPLKNLNNIMWRMKFIILALKKNNAINLASLIFNFCHSHWLWVWTMAFIALGPGLNLCFLIM